MSYIHGQGLILSLLHDMNEFDERNAAVQSAGWRLFPTGNSTYYAVLRRGPSTFDYDSFGREHVTTSHRTVIELWLRWTNSSETTEELDNLADAVVMHLERYPTLGDPEGVSSPGVSSPNITEAVPAGISETQEIILQGESMPSWARLEVYLDWKEERDIEPELE